MQQLSGNSSGKNNKSCSTFHQESSEIGFAFFWFFYDVLRNLQDSPNHIYYWSYSFSLRPLELSAGSQPCPNFAVKTSESFLTSQCSPLGQWPARLSPASAVGRGRGRVPTPQGFYYGARSGPRDGRRGGALVAGGGGHKELSSGELSTGVRKRAACTALCGPRGGTRMVELTGKPVGRGFHRDCGHGKGGGATERRRRLWAHAWEGADGFIGSSHGVGGILTELRWRLGRHARAGQNSRRTAGPRVARPDSVYGSNTWRARTSRVLGRRRVPWEGARGAQTPRQVRHRSTRPCDTAPLFERLKPQKFV
jgi:hypothetical protein